MKNFILKTVTWLAAIVWLVSACMVDSESWIPTINVIVCSAWLSVFIYANMERWQKI